jgi:hypothetical protein
MAASITPPRPIQRLTRTFIPHLVRNGPPAGRPVFQTPHGLVMVARLDDIALNRVRSGDSQEPAQSTVDLSLA